MQATSATNRRSYVRERKSKAFVDIGEMVNLSAKGESMLWCNGRWCNREHPEIECGWPYSDADVTVWQS